MRLAPEYWESIFATEDPWGYGRSQYEDWKFGLTISLLGDAKPSQALEIACAEGHLTALLAPRVENLKAVDISATAVGRAKVRCRELANVKFEVLDIAEADLPDEQDFVLCSEMLFYFPLDVFKKVAAKIAACLRPGGALLLAHGNLISDDKTRTGFDWGHPFGAKTIGEVFGALGPLGLEREMRSPLFTLQLFRRDLTPGAPRPEPQIEEVALPFDLELSRELEATILWDGAETTRAEAQASELATQVPVLMYHSVADTGPSDLSPYRVTPRSFREQLRYLRRNGYHAIDLDVWAEAMRTRTPIPGRPIILTFDDGYQDFYDHAWPELQRADFSATVFVVTDKVGHRADWDPHSGDGAPLMAWPTLKLLQEAGIRIASHSASHKDFSLLSPTQAHAEGERARQALFDNLGVETTAIAFPWGRYNEGSAQALSRCGYEVAVTTWGGLSGFDSPSMRLPRIEVLGDDDLSDFARRVQGHGPEREAEIAEPVAAPASPAPPPPRVRSDARPIHSSYSMSLASSLDALVGDFVKLQSQLLNELEAPMCLQRRLTEMFCQPLTGAMRRTPASGDVISPGVRLAYGDQLEIDLTIDAKLDHASSPETCINTLRLDMTGVDGWAWLEVDLDWGEIAGVERFQLGLFAQINRPIVVQGGLRFPRVGADAREIIFTTLEIGPKDRSAVASGDLQIPDLIEFDTAASPTFVLYFSTPSDCSIVMHYLNLYFA